MFISVLYTGADLGICEGGMILGEGFGIFLRSPAGPGRVCNNICFYRKVAKCSEAKIFLGLLSSHLFGFIKQCAFPPPKKNKELKADHFFYRSAR